MDRVEASRKNFEGLRLLENGQYEKAIKLFDEALEIDTTYSAAWLNRSEAHRKLGRELEADADKEEAERLMQVNTEMARQRIKVNRRAQIIEQNEQRIVLESGTIIDKSTKSIITGTKYLFWGRRNIPFSDVKGVAVYSRTNLEDWLGIGWVWLWIWSMVLPRLAFGELQGSDRDYCWFVCVNYRGDKKTETEIVAWGGRKDEENMIQLKEIISSVIGK